MKWVIFPFNTISEVHLFLLDLNVLYIHITILVNSKRTIIIFSGMFLIKAEGIKVWYYAEITNVKQYSHAIMFRSPRIDVFVITLGSFIGPSTVYQAHQWIIIYTTACNISFSIILLIYSFWIVSTIS